MKILKRIGQSIVTIIIVICVFFTIEFVAYFNSAKRCGYTTEDAGKYAEKMVNEIYIYPINEWMENLNNNKWKPKFIDELEKYEIPMENWNINWNSLNKKDP